MDFAAAWSKITPATKTARQFSAEQINRAGESMTRAFDVASPAFAPFAARWDAEAERRRQLRTPEHLKALLTAQRAYNSARSMAAQAQHQRKAAKAATKNPLSGIRRAARAADKGARHHAADAKADVKAAKANYPVTLRRRAVQLHAAHALPGSVASYLLSTPHDWTVWPASVSAGLIGLNVVGLWLGRRTVTASVLDDGLSAEERQLMERLDPSYWVQHADDRGVSGTVTAPPALTSAGIEAAIRLDGQWTVKKLRAAADSVRALLGARTDLPMLITAGARGGWGVIRLRTRSAAPDGIIAWRPGDAFGVDMVTGEDVAVPLGRRMLIAGMSGAGKSITSRPLMYDASQGPTNVLVIIDLKKVEGRLWDHRARVAYTPAEVIALVEELVEEMTERLDVLPKGQATLVPTAERPRITVVVDEGAEVMASCDGVETVVGMTEKGRPITEKRNALDGLDSIARMGRAACIDLWWMTQSPTYGDGVPRQIAKQLGTRIGLAVESPSEARVVFGESAQEKGWKADELPMPGVAMVRDGKRSPDPVKVRYIDDAAVIALPDQRIWSREDLEAEEPTGGRRLTLVKAEAVPVPRADETSAAPAALTDAESAVLDAVRAAGGPVRQKDVVTSSGLAKGTVSKTVTRLVEAGLLARAEDGALTAAAGEVSA